MPFTKKPHAFKAAINEVTIGTGDKAVTIGGENTYPFYTFDNTILRTSLSSARRYPTSDTRTRPKDTKPSSAPTTSWKEQRKQLPWTK